MGKIIKEEYIKAKEIVKEYEKQNKCDCQNTVNRVFYDTYPYGHNISYDECLVCGEWHNFYTF